MTEQDPLTAHDNEDSNSAFSFDEAVSALIQGISGLYCTEESTEILLGEFAPVDNLCMTNIKTKKKEMKNPFPKKQNSHPNQLQ